MATSIELQHIHKRLGGRVVLDDIQLKFAPGSVTALIGPSGSGKSTILKHLNGLLRPDRGQVHIGGATLDYSRLTPLRRRIGYHVQGSALFPHMTIHQNITLLATLEGWDPGRIQSRLTRLLGFVNLHSELLERYPHELSGGQQQRVGLCRAMMLQPEIFLLDEPFGALDPITKKEIYAQLKMMQATEAVTTVLVTHDMREALHLADEIVILNEGRIEQHAPAGDITRYPANAFVADFLKGQLD